MSRPRNNNKEMFEAAIDGDTPLLQRMLDNGANPEARDAQGLTILNHAVHNGWVDIVQLLATKYEVNLDCTNGSSRPIVDAADQGDLELVKLLLSQGADPRLTADPNSKTRGRVIPTTAYGFAVGRGYDGIVKLLLDDPRVDKETKTNGLAPLVCAAFGGHKNTVRLLLTEGVEPNMRSLGGTTPLMAAASLEDNQNSADIIMLMLSHPKVDPNATDDDGGNAVARAATIGGLESLRTLLAAGTIHPDIADNKVVATPTMRVATGGSTEKLRLLLADKRVDLNRRDKNGESALTYAIKAGRGDNVRLLLETKRFDLKEQDVHGHTALMFACLHHHVEIVKLLLATGKCNLEQRKKSGGTALLCVVKHLSHPSVDEDRVQRAMEIIQLILATGHDLLDISDNKMPLLVSAIRSRVPRIVQLFLEAGIPITAGAIHDARRTDTRIELMLKDRVLSRCLSRVDLM